MTVRIGLGSSRDTRSTHPAWERTCLLRAPKSPCETSLGKGPPGVTTKAAQAHNCGITSHLGKRRIRIGKRLTGLSTPIGGVSLETIPDVARQVSYMVVNYL